MLQPDVRSRGRGAGAQRESDAWTRPGRSQTVDAAPLADHSCLLRRTTGRCGCSSRSARWRQQAMMDPVFEFCVVPFCLRPPCSSLKVGGGLQCQRSRQFRVRPSSSQMFQMLICHNPFDNAKQHNNQTQTQSQRSASKQRIGSSEQNAKTLHNARKSLNSIQQHKCACHQTEHAAEVRDRPIGDEAGQLYVCANSGRFESGPCSQEKHLSRILGKPSSPARGTFPASVRHQ